MPGLHVGDQGHYFDGGDNENAMCFVKSRVSNLFQISYFINRICRYVQLIYQTGTL